MRRTLLIFAVLLSVSVSYGQYSAFLADHSFRYAATPGFVNITELNGAIGIVDHEGPDDSAEDPESLNSKYYYGVTNITGYQIDRNFFGGIGLGYLHYEGGNFFPLFLEYKFSIYLKHFTAYFYSDGGTLINPDDFYDDSKIFINPGLGLSRTISQKIEINLSAGYMVQARTTISRVTFLNLRLGVALRKNAFRMFRSEKSVVK